MHRLIAIFCVVAFSAAANTAGLWKASPACGDERLTSAQRSTCEVAELNQIASAIDSMSADLEIKLTGRKRNALIDTSRVFVIERNSCSNDPPTVRECVANILNWRLKALERATVASSSIFSEVKNYNFIGVPYALKWGRDLIGRTVSVSGCMTVDPGTPPENRTNGALHTWPSEPVSSSLPVVFSSMNETRAVWFYDQKRPCSYWKGTLERRRGKMILTNVEP